MAGWDDVSAPAQQPTGWDAVSQPVQAPKVPDMSGVQKMAQQNLLQASQPTEGGEGKPQAPQSPAQNIDTALGFGAVSTLKGENQTTPLTAEHRAELIDQYNNGGADNPGAHFQNVLLAVSHVLAGWSTRQIAPAVEGLTGTEIGASAQNIGARALGTLAYTGLNTENRQKLIESGQLGDVNQIAKSLTGNPEHDRNAEDIARWNALLGPGVGAAWTLPASLSAPLLNPLLNKVNKAVGANNEGSLIPGGEELAMNLAGLFGGMGAREAAGKKIEGGIPPEEPPPGGGGGGSLPGGVAPNTPALGPWDRVPGGEAMKQIVADHLEKPVATSQDVDNVIHDGFKNIAPKASDFENTAAIISDLVYHGTPPQEFVDSLQNIYKQTGVRPEQVFEAAKRDPETMAAVQEGRIPPVYEHLIDKRPPIPPEVQAAMDSLSKAHDAGEMPLTLSQEGASTAGPLSALTKIFNPTGVSKAATDMATAIRQGRGPVQQYVAQIQDGFSQFAKQISMLPEDARLKFINDIQTRSKGSTIADPHLQMLADKIKDVYNTMADKLSQLFPDFKTRKDYFTHQYADEAAAEKFFSDWAAKQGSGRNLQQREFPTLKEAMGAGLKPKTTDPIETVMSYVINVGKLEAAHKTLDLARESGIAEYFPEGKQPDGWVPLGGKLAEINGNLLYAPEDAARVYNNDISKGITGPAGEIMNAVGRVNNFNNMLTLALGTYHATVTTLSSMSKDVGRALTQGTLEDRGKALASAATAPVSNTIQGGKLIDAYLGRRELTPEAQRTMDALVRNNAVNIKQQEYWKSGPARNYIDVFQHGSVAEEIEHAKQAMQEAPVKGTVGVIANEVGRVMNTVSAPLFEYYIPRIKLAATFNEMHAWMKDHPDATHEEVDKAAQDIGNNSDNAFGEMNRDNLFWHNITRQSLQLAFLSYSWIAGAARMLQGIPDIGKTIMGKQELTSNARYLMGMAATYAAVNGVRTYLGTGHAPNQILDFVYPRTGGTTSQGQEERELLPSHIGQFTQYLYHGIGELGNEASPTLKLMYHLLSNSDFRGLPITNANNPWYEEQRWNDYAKYVLGEETPIGLKTFINGKKAGSKITDVERTLGVRQAPREITDPQGYEEMMEHVHDAEYKKKLKSDKKMQDQLEE